MSLLIQALKQAERKNKLAAQQAARVDVEMPPAPEGGAISAVPVTPSGVDTIAPQTPAGSPAAPGRSERPDLSLEATESRPPRQDYPSLHSMEELSESALADANLDTDLPGMPELPEPETYPRQAEPEHTPPEKAPTAPPSISPALEESVEPALEPADAAPYLVPAAGLKNRTGLSQSQRRWALVTGIALLIGAAVLWSPLVLSPDDSNMRYKSDFQAIRSPAPAISPTGAFGTTPENTVAPAQIDTVTGPIASATEAVTLTADPVAAETSAGNDTAASIAPASAQTTPESADASRSAVAAPAAPAAPAGTADAKVSAPRPAEKSPATITRTTRTSAAAGSASSAKPAMPPVRFVRVAPTRQSSGDLLNQGYTALREQRLTEAEAAYQQAVRLDRNSIDGWIGLASVASHRGSTAMAEQYYRRALQIDPNDAVARSGILSLGGMALADESESALRTLSSNPQAQSSAQLTLGNTLASQGRWREAQQAYFNANAAQPDRPDVLFNLAVSLEQIHQPAAALRYYQQALDKAGNSAVMFDATVVRQRITALQANGSQ